MEWTQYITLAVCFVISILVIRAGRFEGNRILLVLLLMLMGSCRGCYYGGCGESCTVEMVGTPAYDPNR